VALDVAVFPVGALMLYYTDADLLSDEYPSIVGEQSVHLEIDYPDA